MRTVLEWSVGASLWWWLFREQPAATAVVTIVVLFAEIVRRELFRRPAQPPQQVRRAGAMFEQAKSSTGYAPQGNGRGSKVLAQMLGKDVR